MIIILLPCIHLYYTYICISVCFLGCSYFFVALFSLISLLLFFILWDACNQSSPFDVVLLLFSIFAAFRGFFLLIFCCSLFAAHTILGYEETQKIMRIDLLKNSSEFASYPYSVLFSPPGLLWRIWVGSIWVGSIWVANFWVSFCQILSFWDKEGHKYWGTGIIITVWATIIHHCQRLPKVEFKFFAQSRQTGIRHACI